MKKMTLTIVMVFTLSIFAFANGDLPHGGGKTCPNGQTTCLVENEPTGETNIDKSETETSESDTVIKDLIDYLISIFD